MPYKLRKARNKELYYVVDSTGDKYSKEPIPLARAKRQITALHINTGHGKPKRKLQGGISEDEVDAEGYLASEERTISAWVGFKSKIKSRLDAEQRTRLPEIEKVLDGIIAYVSSEGKASPDGYIPSKITDPIYHLLFPDKYGEYTGGSWEYKMTAIRKKLSPLLNARDELEDTLMRLKSIGRAYTTSPKAKRLAQVNKKINSLEKELEYWMQQEQARLPTINEESEEDTDEKINGEGKEMDDLRYRKFVRSVTNIPPPPSYPHPDEPYIVSTRNPLRNAPVRVTTNDYMRQIGVTGMSNLYVDAIRLSQQNQRDEEERARNQARSDAEKARQAAEEQAVRDYYDKRARERAAKEQEEYKKSKMFGALMYTRVIKPIKKMFSNENKEHAKRADEATDGYHRYLAEKRKRDNFNARQRELNERKRLLGEGMSGSGVRREMRINPENGKKVYSYYNTEGVGLGEVEIPSREETDFNEREYKDWVKEELRKINTELWHKDNESRSSRTNLKRKRGKDLNINFNPEIARVVGEVPHLDDLYYQSHPPKDLADVIEDDITELNEARELESRGEPPIYKPPPPVGRGRKRGGMFNPLNTVKSPEDQAKAVLTRILDSANASLAKSALNAEGQKTMEEVMNQAARELAMSGNLGAVNYLNTLRGPYEEKPVYYEQNPTARNKMAKEMGLTLAGKGRLKFAKKYLKGQGLPHGKKECEKLCSVMDAEGVVFE